MLSIGSILFLWTKKTEDILNKLKLPSIENHEIKKSEVDLYMNLSEFKHINKAVYQCIFYLYIIFIIHSNFVI